MAIPKYNELYHLFLLSLQDGNAHPMKDVRDFIAQSLHLTEQELSLLPASGYQRTIFSDRVGWART